MNKLIWLFIIGVSLIDVGFTWECRKTMSQWESNAVAATIVEHGGAVGAITYRAGWLGFAGLMTRTKNRLSWLITPVWGLGHAYLLFILMQSVPFLSTLAG